jgi:hypothetical protein
LGFGPGEVFDGIARLAGIANGYGAGLEAWTHGAHTDMWVFASDAPGAPASRGDGLAVLDASALGM